MPRSHPRRREPRVPRAICVALTLAVLAALPSGAAAAPSPERFEIESLSARPDAVSGGDVLAAVGVPETVPVHQTRIRLNGADVTADFALERPGSRRLVGLVDGLVLGRNELLADANGNGRGRPLNSLELVNHPISGPVFSGPHQQPFICRTAGTDLGPPLDADCSTPTRVDYYYRSSESNSFKPLADPRSRPADLAQTTTRAGDTADYVVRVESGTINRAVYRWAVLAAGGETGSGWNGRLRYEFGGGCGTGHHQGTLGPTAVLDNDVLAEGYANATATLNTLGVNCNDVLSAETMSMVKERLIEELRRPPVWTMGWGGSGGAIQQLMIAQNYPGLLDGIVPSATFQDNGLAEPADCRLLNRYFAAFGTGMTAAQRQAIMGFRNLNACVAWDVAFADVIVADRGCDPSVPASLIYNAATNPGGIRCTIWDNQVNIYGTDPATGFAPRTLDNVGVQYGLEALKAGTITLDRFLDLNERIGGYDNDGRPRAARTVADTGAIETAYRTGRVTTDTGALPDVPILDMRSYTDAAVDIHTYIHSYIVRERLRRANGSAANQIMWRSAPSAASSAPMATAARQTMAGWLDAIAADPSDRPLPEKVVAAKPAQAVDACWTATGERIDDPAEIGATGPCTTLYPPASTPRLRSGAPLAMNAIKCRLRPVDLAEYGAVSPAQEQRLRAAFPDGVCDYSRPGIGEQPLAGTWLSFGP